MTAVALILTTQGPNTDVAGVAVIGTLTDGVVTITNGDNTDMASWSIELLDAPIGSALVPVVLAAAATATPSATFNPDVPGTYRISLDTIGTSGETSKDVRCFGVRNVRGYIPPPYQMDPEPLPLPYTGDPTAKPDEQNYNAQGLGWKGDGVSGQQEQFQRTYEDLPSLTISATPFTVTTTNEEPLYLVDLSAIGGAAAVNLTTTNLRIGQVFRVVATSGSIYAVTVTPPGGHTIDGAASVTIKSGDSASFVYLGGVIWSVLSSSTASIANTDVTAEALTGNRFNLTIGSSKSQLQEIIDRLSFAGAHTFTGLPTLQAGLTLNTQNPFAVDSSAADVIWTVNQNGYLQFKEESSGDIVLDISPGASGGSDLLKIGLTRIELSALTAERFIYIKGITTPGGSNGANLSFQGQPGQSQSGGSPNNDGGDFALYMGAAGTGGTGVGKIGRMLKLYSGRKVVESGEPFNSISGASTEVIGYTMVDGEYLTATVYVQSTASGGGFCMIHETQSFSMAGGTAALVSTASADHSAITSSTSPTIVWGTTPGGGQGVEVSINAASETLTGMVYLVVREGA